MSAHIVTAEEAQKRLAVAAWIVEHGVRPSPQAEQLLILNERVRDLAHTVVVQADQVAAVLALHPKIEHPTMGCCAPPKLCNGHPPACGGAEHNLGRPTYPCPTARALGVTA